ncbi:unnamed protein product [Periconia digitata]|uniref:Uncharacterized protein n=1 Tax=Periconia digitata TaxID=1303443 RepID=A0A9W4UX27_9PLEO|nr:unnamed protein product [Periconia digitata]
MSVTVGDFLFQRLAAVGVQRVHTRSSSTIFLGSIQRSNLDFSGQPSLISPTETLCFLASSSDLLACYSDAVRFLGSRPIVIIHELDSAQFTSTTTYTSTLDFAASTILNSPMTAVSQIDRMLRALTYASKPVYIGLSLAVAGQTVSVPTLQMGWSAPTSGSSGMKGDNASSEEIEAAEAGQ